MLWCDLKYCSITQTSKIIFRFCWSQSKTTIYDISEFSCGVVGSEDRSAVARLASEFWHVVQHTSCRWQLSCVVSSTVSLVVGTNTVYIPHTLQYSVLYPLTMLTLSQNVEMLMLYHACFLWPWWHINTVWLYCLSVTHTVFYFCLPAAKHHVARYWPYRLIFWLKYL